MHAACSPISLLVSPVTGPILFAKPVSPWTSMPGRLARNYVPLRQFAREAYDDETVARAIRNGIDASGQPLDRLMPRYALEAADASALVAYLRQLSAAPPTGLADGRLQLATIVTGDADPLRARLVAETLTTWSRSAVLGGIALDLKVWTLVGPAGTWEEQLRHYNSQQPVYAVLSGAGRAHWEPVRDFCERTRVPCLFPVVDRAPSGAKYFYTLYFTTGVPLEARLLARTLKESVPRPTRVVQIVADDAGEAAAGLLAVSLDSIPNETRLWRADAPAGLIEDLKPGDALVGWLGLDQLQRLTEARPQGPGIDRVLFSAQLAPPDKADVPLPWRQVARWVSARSDPRRLRVKGALGYVPWLAHLKLPTEDDALLSEIHAASYFFGEALTRMGRNWNREFLMETLENAHFSAPAGSAFFSLSLAPGQREAAKAGHLLGFDGPDFRQVVPIGPRITP
jgi:hypothetical protein